MRARCGLIWSLLFRRGTQFGGSGIFIYLIPMVTRLVLPGEFRQLPGNEPFLKTSGRNYNFFVLGSLVWGRFLPVVKTVKTVNKLTAPTHQKTEFAE